jgi:hypothetical protein
MSGRTGEKAGWLGGFAGAFLWVLILGVVFLFQGRWAAGASGLLLSAGALAAVYLARPWGHPDTRYWKLLLVPLAAFTLAIPWAILSFGLDTLREENLSPWLLLTLFPMFGTPFFALGRKRWRDGDR